MSGIDPRADPLLVNGSRLGVTGYFRTATVTLLSAEVDGSMRLWQDKPDVMAAAMGRLNQIVGDVIAAHGGMRPVEHGEGDSFEVAFARGDSLPFEHVAYLQHQQAFNHSLERGDDGLRQRVGGLCDINLARSRFGESLEGRFAHHGSPTA